MKKTVFFNDYESFFDDTFTVNAEYADENDSALLIVGKVGFDSIEHVLRRGHRVVVSFEKDFEVKLLKTSPTQVEVDVREIENLKSKYTLFLDYSVVAIPESDENFSSQEIDELTEKVTQLQSDFSEYRRLSREEAEFLRASVELLIKKLDSSSKSAWKYTATGVVASLLMTISPDTYVEIASKAGVAIQNLLPK
ncbi:hypothetical protein A9264_14330 [Vibrio sp. UCD-FRSSP16_10]|uniref:hypothetical protein n=1 Tax=unclassified Vibrio TaxID=2614977 RepID=UPI0007FEDB27|nr:MULTISPECIES: hypothetical protein [unclassified Vibrio]OBT13280.1 hypothetical protein A9260_14710 [Vibrio sp. UCD-FRSSP16_30]OBT19630.1 hypothetical protein A9264_14330 [Vibrio sp. UCD-FRSSP16_10]